MPKSFVWSNPAVGYLQRFNAFNSRWYRVAHLDFISNCVWFPRLIYCNIFYSFHQVLCAFPKCLSSHSWINSVLFFRPSLNVPKVIISNAQCPGGKKRWCTIFFEDIILLPCSSGAPIQGGLPWAAHCYLIAIILLFYGSLDCCSIMLKRRYLNSFVLVDHI